MNNNSSGRHMRRGTFWERLSRRTASRQMMKEARHSFGMRICSRRDGLSFNITARHIARLKEWQKPEKPPIQIKPPPDVPSATRRTPLSDAPSSRNSAMHSSFVRCKSFAHFTIHDCNSKVCCSGIGNASRSQSHNVCAGQAAQPAIAPRVSPRASR